MNEQINDGGCAFPYVCQDISKFQAHEGGMSLRDYSAIKFAAAQISMEGMEGCDKEHICAMSYEMADAMLAERSRK